MQTGKLAMMASKAAISTTGHNISNANTEGYSRQRTIQATTPPIQNGRSVLETAVPVPKKFRPF
jgi:flagellar hook-associated protein 1 FlgK